MTTPEPTTGERLARIEEKLDALLRQMSTDGTRVQTSITDHETRIRALERAKWTAAGFAAAGGGALSAILTQLIGG